VCVCVFVWGVVRWEGTREQSSRKVTRIPVFKVRSKAWSKEECLENKKISGKGVVEKRGR
jgi:hypothetical protein